MTPHEMLAKSLENMRVRSVDVEARRRWYDGNHPADLGSKAWDKTFATPLAKYVDNQCRIVVNNRAAPLLPQSFVARSGSTLEKGLAQWATTRVGEEAPELLQAIRMAKWSGAPVPVYVDYNAAKEVSLYPLDPVKADVVVDRGGAKRWMAWLWLDDDGFINATVETPVEIVWLASRAKLGSPLAGDFTIRDVRPNPLGRVSAVVFDEGASIIDEIWPLNALLNHSLQTQHVVSETAATPFRVWWGIQTFDPVTGTLLGLQPKMNAATGSRDLSIPTVKDMAGSDRKVQQLDSRSPQEWIAIQDAHRLNICRNGSIPAFMAQVGSQALSGDALEIAYMPFVGAVGEDQRLYRGEQNELASLMVSRQLALVGGNAAAPVRFDTQFSTIATSTQSSRFDQFSKAVTAGMSIQDAAVECLGATHEEALKFAANAEAVTARAAEQAGRQFLAGV